MKTLLQFETETPEDTMRVENILRADELCFALKEILNLVDTYRLSTELREECKKVIQKLGLEPLLR